MEVFCFLGVWESVGVELFDAFTGLSFWWVLVLSAGGVSLDGLAGVDAKAGVVGIVLKLVDSSWRDLPLIICLTQTSSITLTACVSHIIGFFAVSWSCG